MRIKIPTGEYQVSINEHGHVCLPALGYRAWTLEVLMELLRQDFGKVKLPPNAFTHELHILEECLRYGFKSVDLKKITVNGMRFALTPGGLLTSKKRKSPQNTDGSESRFYWATVLEKGRTSWRQIFTESDLMKHGITP